jgi:hypothetical protein
MQGCTRDISRDPALLDRAVNRILMVAQHHAERAASRLDLASPKLAGVIDQNQTQPAGHHAAELRRILQGWR